MLAAANGQMYSYKVEIDSVAGLIHVYRGGVLQVQWTDSTPLSSGDSMALTTESSAVTFDDVTVTQLPKTLLYIHTDHLGSVTVLTYGNDHMTALHGKPVPTTGALYLPFGAYRLDPNAKVTNYGFTGHVENRSVGLTYMNARYYLSDLGRFASADMIVPDPNNPQAFNRYNYVYNNVVNLIDPSGFDPLDDEWEQAFCAAHFGPGEECTITDADRQARLYSTIFNGPISDSSIWTSADWEFYLQNRVVLFLNLQEGRESLADFANQIERLLQWYSPGEDANVVQAIALLYAGVPYHIDSWLEVMARGIGGDPIAVPQCPRRNRCAWLNHGMEGFGPQFRNEGEENTHHYAGHLLAGYHLSRSVVGFGTEVRERIQGRRGGADAADLAMGHIANEHGRGIYLGEFTIWDLPQRIRIDLGN